MKKLWKNKTFWRWALLVAIGVTTLIIWSLSLRSGNASSRQSEKISDPLNVVTGAKMDLFIVVRKIAHFVEFFGLGLLWGAYGRLRPVKGALLYGLVVGVIDEALQIITPGRAPGFGDVVLDYCGYFCGFMLVFLVAKWWIYRKSRSMKK